MGQPRKKSTNWQRIRKLFNDIHLWLGLGSGLIVLVICFSGTAYVYNTELVEMASPHLYEVTPAAGARRMAPEKLLEKVQEASGGKVTTVNIPSDPERTYQFYVKKEGEKSRFGTAYMVNPYTGDIVGNSQEESSTKAFMGTMFSLHRWLLLDKVETPILSTMTNRELGSKISGWTTIIFTLGCITGLMIWFPQKLRTWRQGLKIKFSGNWKRINHDLHNTLAFYALIFLLVLGLTGPQWSFEWYREGLQKTLGTYKPRETKERGNNAVVAQKSAPGEKPGGNRFSTPDRKKPETRSASAKTAKDSVAAIMTQPAQITAYLETAGKRLPYTGNYSVSLQEDADSPVTVAKTRIGFFAPAAGDRLTLDRNTAAVVKADIFRDKPFNERIAGSIKALHVGNVYGGFSKLLYFIACLIATTLPVTGTLIWINKLKKKKRRSPLPARAHQEPGLNTAVLGNV